MTGEEQGRLTQNELSMEERCKGVYVSSLVLLSVTALRRSELHLNLARPFPRRSQGTCA